LVIVGCKASHKDFLIKIQLVILPLGALLGLWDLLRHRRNNERRITTRTAPPTPPPKIAHFLLELPPSRQ